MITGKLNTTETAMTADPLLVVVHIWDGWTQRAPEPLGTSKGCNFENHVIITKCGEEIKYTMKHNYSTNPEKSTCVNCLSYYR